MKDIRPITTTARAVLWLACIVFICTNTNVSAATLFDQPAMMVTGQSGTGISSNDIDAVIEETQAWDNFVLTVPVQITGIEWTGQYNGPFDAATNLRLNNDFNIQITPNLANRPNITPSARLLDLTLDSGRAGINDGLDVTETVLSGQQHASGGAVIRYSADISPLSLDAGTYWLSVQGELGHLTTADPEWSWVFSSVGDDRLFSYDEKFDPIGSQPGISVARDAGFTLLGTTQGSSFPGDFDSNGLLQANDIDLLASAIRNSSNDSVFDVNSDGSVNSSDHTFWIETLFGTLLGDSNLDNQVNFDDFLPLSANFGQTTGWANGDFDGDGETLFADFVSFAQNFGLNAGGAAAGAPPSLVAVPEPSNSFNTLFILLVLLVQIRKRLLKMS